MFMNHQRIGFHNVYVDHMTTTTVQLHRMKHMHLFYENIIPLLRHGGMLDDLSTVYVPFNPVSVKHFYRSMPKLGKDVLVTFFNKNKLRNTGQNNTGKDVCHWETITDNNELQDKDYDVARDQFLKGHGIQPCRDCRSNNSKEKIIMELEDMSIHLTSELDKLHNFKKSPNGEYINTQFFILATIPITYC